MSITASRASPRAIALGAIALAALLGLLVSAPPVAAQRLSVTRALDSELFGRTADFTVYAQGHRLAGDVGAIFALPGERLAFTVADQAPTANVQLDTQGLGSAAQSVDNGFYWQAPRTPGLYPIRLVNRATGGEMRLNVFVQTPFDAGDDALNGYDIGHYEPVARVKDPHNGPPQALIEVSKATARARVSPHFTIGDFLCHQQPEHWPKYVLIKPALLAKLERIRSALIEAGIDGRGLVVMSGYRTPWYNADIGNTTVYSQHLFGSAADIFVDADNDGEMDDLNADGVISTADAEWLADLVESVTATHPALAGGLSAYPANAYHGPFIHIDVRGIAVRW